LKGSLLTCKISVPHSGDTNDANLARLLRRVVWCVFLGVSKEINAFETSGSSRPTTQLRIPKYRTLNSQISNQVCTVIIFWILCEIW